MKASVPIRFLAVAAAVASAGSLTAIGLAESASAAPRVLVTCAHVKAPAPTKAGAVKAALTGCIVPKATGGKGTLTTTVGSGSATITWNHTGTTTLTFTEAAETKPDEKETQGCPAHTTEIVASGMVTGGTGAAAKSITSGSAFRAEVCVTAKLVTTNEPGNKLRI